MNNQNYMDKQNLSTSFDQKIPISFFFFKSLAFSLCFSFSITFNHVSFNYINNQISNNQIFSNQKLNKLSVFMQLIRYPTIPSVSSQVIRYDFSFGFLILIWLRSDFATGFWIKLSTFFLSDCWHDFDD